MGSRSATVDVSVAYRPFPWGRPAYAVAAAVYFGLISVLSSQVPGRLFEFLPDLEAVFFLRTLVTNLAHVPLFGGFAFFVIFAVGSAVPSFRSRPIPYLLTGTITVFLGAADELHQAFVPGRFPSHWDLALDGVGALFACFLVSAIAANRSRSARFSCCLAGLAVLALFVGVLASIAGHRSSRPWRKLARIVLPIAEDGLIDGFERDHVWRGAGPRESGLKPEQFSLTFRSDWKTEGDTSLSVTFPNEQWAGISTREIPVDLRGFLGFSVDVQWPDDSPIDQLGVRLIDYSRNASELHVDVVAGAQTVVFLFDDFPEFVDTSDLDVMTLMVRRHGREMTAAFDRLRVFR